MPDITMCANKSCPLKKKCYRFVAEPDKGYQSYALFVYDKKIKFCEDFWGLLNNI